MATSLHTPPETVKEPEMGIEDLITDRFEAGIIDVMGPKSGWTVADVAAASTAISMKRIADILDGTAAGVPISSTIFAGSQQRD